MNRRTWKEFITKRSTIWTLSLCLVGAIVLGGMAAVNSSRSNDTQTETELGQIAYLEEDLDEENTNDEDTDVDADNGSAADVSTDLILGDDFAADTNDSTDADAGTADSSSDDDVSGTDSTASSDNVTSGADSADASDGTISENSENTGATASESNSSDADGSSDSGDSTAEDTAENTSDAASADSEEASSASIISEQALIDAGVSFTDEQSLLWPSAGTITIDYSMDKSVYFATLNQYKYNPALIISSDTGNQVLAAAKGIVESISIDEETGTTLVLNIGNGYRLTYGQLMEPAVSEGDIVEAGDLLAYISEPTKYYSTEGSNLYFAMTKDGEPVDPVLYLE